MLDRAWLRQMMIEEAMGWVSHIMAKDRNPNAAKIEARCRRHFERMNFREAIDYLIAETDDPEEARARWIISVGSGMLRSIADLRPS